MLLTNLLLMVVLGVDAPGIRLPEFVVPSPKPVPVSPLAAQPLNDAEMYVVDSDVELFIRTTPGKLLTVTPEVGPLRIRGKFAGGDGKVVTKNFKGKYLVIIEAVGVGRAELFLIPKGVIDDKAILQRTIDCGQGPRPPPAGAIPSVIGLPQGNARAVLSDAKFTTGIVTSETNAAPAGNVFRQEPVAGTESPIGSAVALWVSLGSKPVDPAPIPEPGLHVLIVYESADQSASIATITRSRVIREYLDAKCPADADGKTKAYRIWDKDVSPAGDLPVWQQAFARPRASVPWIVVSNGTAGFEGPLPSTVAATMDLLKKFGG